MKFLMGNTRVAMQLRLTFTFVIIPMLNPDGVLVGNGRYNLQGVDLNRKFACIDTKFYAPVSSLTALVQRLATKRQMYIYCDIHGHSKRFNSFIYGSDDTALHAKAREFARLLKIYCGDKFNMDDCLFNNQEPEKTHSSRIALHKLGVPLAFTFENSTGGCSLGLKARTHFTTLDYVQIGEGFCHAILDFNRIYPNLAAEKQVAHGPKLKLKLKPKPKPKPKEPSRTDSAKSFKPSCLPKHQFYSMPTENESSSKLRTCERKKATTAIKKPAEKGTIEMKKKTPIKSGTLAVQKATTATKKKTPIEGGTLAEQKATTATKAKAPTKGGTSTVSSSRDKVTSKSVAAKNMPTSLASAQLPKARKKLLATEVRAMKKMKAVQGPSPAEKHTLEPKKPLPHKNVSLYKNFSVKWPYEDYVKKTGMKHKRGKPVSKERFAAAESKFKENNMDKNELDVVYQCNSAFVYKITLPGETLIFESRFESGNLQQAVCLVQNSTDSGKGNQPTPSQPSADSTSTIVQNSTDSGKDVQLTPRQPSSDSTSTIVQDSTDSGKYDQPMSRQPSTDSTSTMKAEKLFLKREPSREWKVAEKPTIPNSYHLTLRKDLILCLDPPKALKELNVAETQWFYFSVENMAQDKAYIFSIESTEKSDSPFSSRIKPLVYSEKAAKEKGVGWHRIGDSMRYDRREIGKSALSKKVLTFSYTTSYEEDTVYFASDYPYTYTALMDYLKKIGLLRQLPCHFKKNVLCSTHMGNIIPWITITKGDTQPDCLTKPVIIIMARAHPGEACSSWVCKGIMDFLISDDKDAEELRRIFIFKIIPMLNPDGVILGNWRRDLMGFDMNRQYRHPRIPASSVIKETTSFIQKCTSTGKLYIFCDIHGHSELCNRLVFGCKSKSSLAAAEEFVHTLVKNSSHMISKEDCIFNSTEVEEKYTARMAAQTHYIPLSFTFQVTNAGTSTGLLGMLHVDIDDYQNLGEFFCRGVLDYYKTRKSLEKRAVHRVRAVQ